MYDFTDGVKIEDWIKGLSNEELGWLGSTYYIEDKLEEIENWMDDMDIKKIESEFQEIIVMLKLAKIEFNKRVDEGRIE